MNLQGTVETTLIIAGVLGFIVGGGSFTTREKVADVAPVEIEK